MSIIACPKCSKRISSQAAICSHCGFRLGEVTEEDVRVFRERQLRDRVHRLNMISYGAITLFLGAFGWYWWDTKGFVQPSTAGPVTVMWLAGGAYLVVRALLFLSRARGKASR